MMKVEIYSDVVCPWCYGVPGAQEPEIFLQVLEEVERELSAR